MLLFHRKATINCCLILSHCHCFLRFWGCSLWAPIRSGLGAVCLHRSVSRGWGYPGWSPTSVKSLSETCETCSLHCSTRTKCCCPLFRSLSLTFPLYFLSFHFLSHHAPPSLPLLLPDSQICSCVHLTSPIKVVGSDDSRDVSVCHVFTLILPSP